MTIDPQNGVQAHTITKSKSKKRTLFSAGLIALIAGVSFVATPTVPSVAGVAEKGARGEAKIGSKAGAKLAAMKQRAKANRGAKASKAKRINNASSQATIKTGINTSSSRSKGISASSANTMQTRINKSNQRLRKPSSTRRVNRLVASGVVGGAAYGQSQGSEFFAAFGPSDSKGALFVRYEDAKGDVYYKQENTDNYVRVSGSNIIKTNVEKSYYVQGEAGSTGGNANGAFIRVNKGAKIIDILKSSKSAKRNNKRAAELDYLDLSEQGEVYSAHLGGMALIAGAVDFTKDYMHSHYAHSRKHLKVSHAKPAHTKGGLKAVRVNSSGMVELAGSGGLKHKHKQHHHHAGHASVKLHAKKAYNKSYLATSENPIVIRLEDVY
ncbi:MAG: hypothetical protein AB8B49_01235 [Nitratireductor sp.]